MLGNSNIQNETMQVIMTLSRVGEEKLPLFPHDFAMSALGMDWKHFERKLLSLCLTDGTSEAIAKS